MVHHLSRNVCHGKGCNISKGRYSIVRLEILHDHFTLIDAQAIGDSGWKIRKDLGHRFRRVYNKGVVEAISETKLNQG